MNNMKNWIKYFEGAAKDLQKDLDDMKKLRSPEWLSEKLLKVTPKKLNVVCKCE